MTRTEVCEARVKYAKARLETWEEQGNYEAWSKPLTNLRVSVYREMLIAEEDHLEYARQHNL